MGDQSIQQRLAAVLAADVVGYTRLMEQDTEGTVAAWQSVRGGVINPTVADHSGRIVKLTGDGFLAEFPTVHEAVKCGIALQEGFADGRLEFRIGINLGDIIDDGQDIHGEGVNIAARLEALAEPGGICISGGVYDQVRNRIDATYEDLGEQKVKNVSAPVRVYAIQLDRIAAVSASIEQAIADKPSIAVLPFDKLSGDAEQDFLGDGLTEDIITGLSRIRSFFVIARNSTFQYKGTSPDVRKVAKDLGVRYVVEGSVRRTRDRVRITAQLIDGFTGNLLWAERYDHKFDDLLAIQDEIMLSIVAQLEPELERAEYDRVRVEPPENLGAWELYHRGLLHIFRRTKEDILEGRNLFEKAIERDPNFAGAYAGIAWTFSQDAYLGSTDESREFALRTAQQAVALDHRDAFAYVALGQAHASNGQIAAAISDYEEAIRINSSYALARSLVGSCLSRSGKAEEAIPHLEFAIRLSPSDPGIAAFYARLAAAYLYLGQNEAAVEWGRRAIQKNASWTGRIPYTSALGHLGREDEARPACADLRRIEPDITVEFVQKRVLMPHQPYMDQLLEGLRKAGLRES